MFDKSLQVIGGASILKADDVKSLINIKDELTKSFNTAQVFRTETEMKYSVLQDLKHPTPDAKYWQAVREQNMMFSELIRLSYNYRRNNIKLKKLDIKIEKEKDPLERELLQIEKEENLYAKILMENTAQNRHREILQWSELKSELLPLLKHGDSDVNKHQFDSMRVRFAKEASMVNNNTAIADKINIIGKAESIRSKK